MSGGNGAITKPFTIVRNEALGDKFMDKTYFAFFGEGIAGSTDYDFIVSPVLNTNQGVQDGKVKLKKLWLYGACFHGGKLLLG